MSDGYTDLNSMCEERTKKKLNIDESSQIGRNTEPSNNILDFREVIGI